MTVEPDLRAAAVAAGLSDLDLLKLAMPDVPPAQAIADLRRRYPVCFPGLPKHPRDMTDAEFKSELARITTPAPRIPDYPTDKKVDAMTLDEIERFERFHGINASATERERRARIRARQRDERDMKR